MPDRYSMPVGVAYLDGEAAVARLRELAQALVATRPDVQAVYLFGSLAQDRHVPGSDADLIIVLAQDDRRMVDRMPEFHRAFLDAPLPVEIFPYTAQELEEKKVQGNLFVEQAMKESVLLAAR
jgi:predicted nucleotidyltransferase